MRSREGGAPTACAAKPKAIQRHEVPGRSWNRPGTRCFPPSRLRRRSAYFASCGQARSCWVFSCRNGGTRTHGLAAPSRARCQLRHIPKPSPSSFGAEAPMGQKGGWRRRTPAGTRTRIDGFGDRRARHCTTDAKGGVHDAARLAARSSGRQASRTPPESPEPDSNRRPAAYEAAALPLGHRGLDGPPIAFPMHDESLSARVPCQARHGGTVWWSRRDSNPRPSRCERDALPLRHGPMPAPTYARTGWKRSHSGGGVTPLVPSAGFEPATPTLGGWRSIPELRGQAAADLSLSLAPAA